MGAKNEKSESEIFEKKKPVDKMKIMQRIFAIVLIIIMLFSVFGTFLFWLMQG